MKIEVMKEQTLSQQLFIIQSKDHIVSDMDGEKVLLSIENGKYYNLGVIGGRIWELIYEPIRIGEVINTLLDEYEVEREECEVGVFSFLAHLSEEKLIHFSM